MQICNSSKLIFYSVETPVETRTEFTPLKDDVIPTAEVNVTGVAEQTARVTCIRRKRFAAHTSRNVLRIGEMLLVEGSR